MAATISVSVERGSYGQLVVTAEVPDDLNGGTYYRTEQFYGHSKREAVQMFRAQIREEQL